MILYDWYGFPVLEYDEEIEVPFHETPEYEEAWRKYLAETQKLRDQEKKWEKFRNRKTDSEAT